MKKHLKKIEKFVSDINPNDTFESKELIEKGIIVNTKLEPSYFSLYRLIKNGEIKAINLGNGKQARFIIDGESLRDFLKKRYQLN